MPHVYTGAGALCLTRYRDVRRVLNDSRFEIYKPLVIGDPAHHILDDRDGRHRSHRIRPLSRVLSEHLSARAIQPLTAVIEAFVQACLATAHTHGGMDIVSDLAYPVPMVVMAELMGLPPQELLKLRQLFAAITRGHDMGATVQDRQQAHLALLTIARWLDPLLRQRRPTPLMDAILGVAQAERIDASLVVYWCTMLLYAGSATTQDLIANAVGTLLESPAQARLLAERTELVETAVEEFLRYDGPMQGVGRVAAEDVAVGDLHIKRGQLVYLMLGEANRDPERFPAPYELDLRRRPNPHLAFGHGATYCLGAHLARLEAGLVLKSILPHVLRMSMQHPAAWSDYRLLRERSALCVTLR